VNRSPDVAAALREGELGSASSTFAVAEYREAPGGGPTPRTVAPLHRHREEDEAWYVLEGELSVRLDERVVVAGPGAAVWSRPNVVHTFWNSSPRPTRYLLVMGPKTLEFLHGLHDRASHSPEAVRALADRCGVELLE
jgi:mannose-6-phosphate isomerase-like protein (cupin superfamily)